MEIVGPMTAKEYFAEALRAADKPRDARKAELIDGVLILFPAPLDIHERLYVFLLRLLGEYAERHDLGEVRGSRSAVKLAEDQIYQPDVLFVSRDRPSLFERQGIFGPPDLVVEILSRSTASYDRGAKLAPMTAPASGKSGSSTPPGLKVRRSISGRACGSSP